ncbi:bifunctional UDP-N-acetylglucosamine diphosphorylase/glucosamine-1-phosphate N-acetyltransferase GlmU [soil metagenome]
MLDHVMTTVSYLSPSETVIVADPGVSNCLSSREQVKLSIQKIPLGTADAVAVGLDALDLEEGTVLILNGDVPLVRPESLAAMVDRHRSECAKLTMATFIASDPRKYGRVQRDDGKVIGVIEAADEDRNGMEQIEANGGVYAFDIAWLREHVGKVPVSAAGEYYLTSLIRMLARESADTPFIATVPFEESELIGVDNRERLAEAESILRHRILTRYMRDGVTIVDPERTVIEADVVIEQDVRIEPGCFIRGPSVIRSGAVIGPYSVIENATVGVDAVILQSWVADAVVGDRVRVGPFARIRPGTSIDPDVHIGNFVETKATTIGAGSRVHHFSYLGDATLGTNVNIGAGTITCNYDGYEKHRTVIGNDVFVGCDTMLVAPVELADGSRTGAGAVVTRSVPAGKTVVGVPARPIERRSSEKSQGEHGR